MASHQYVYVMNRLSKAWPGGKEVLKKYQPVISARCQNWRFGSEWIGQINLAENHGWN